jgi:hypothetical protein
MDVQWPANTSVESRIHQGRAFCVCLAVSAEAFRRKNMALERAKLWTYGYTGFSPLTANRTRYTLLVAVM